MLSTTILRLLLWFFYYILEQFRQCGIFLLILFPGIMIPFYSFRKMPTSFQLLLCLYFWGVVTPVYPLFISSSFLCYLYFFNHKFCRFVFCEFLFFFMSILTIRLLWVLFFLILIMLLMWTWRSFCGSFWLQLCLYHCYIAFFSFNNLYFKISSIIIYVFWKLLVATRFFIPYIFQYFITIFWKLSSNATKLIFKCTDINSVFWMTSNLALKIYDHVGSKSLLDLVL